MSFNWTQMIPGVGHEYVHVATAAVATAGLIVAASVARASLGKGEAAVVPAGKFSVRGIFELLTEFMMDLTDKVIGHHGRKYTPLFASIFTFVLFNNLIGVIPGMTPATENINTTFAIGIFSFLVYNFFGFKEVGIGYLKHFVGPVWWLFPLMIPIEIFSNALRPLTLGLRLANVLTGDHTVLSVFLDLVPIGVPVIFYGLGLFVAFIQAFVLTLLSMVYVALATAHDH